MLDKVSDQGTIRRPRVWRHYWRKPGVIYRKSLPVAQNHRSLDHILQLAHVARPVIGLKQVQGALVDMSNAFARSFRVASDQILDQNGNIVAALPQCWHSKREHVEAVEEILTEGAFSDGCTQVPICCCEHSYVNRNRLAPSHSFELTVLENS